jgi:hypothetical protein
MRDLGSRDVVTGQEPDLDHPRKPEGSDEVGQLGTFRWRREVQDILDAIRQGLFEAVASAEAGLGPVAEHSLDRLGAQADQLVVAHAGAKVLPGPAIAGAGEAVVGREGHDGENGALGVARVPRVPDVGDLGHVRLDGIGGAWIGDVDGFGRNTGWEDRRHVGGSGCLAHG